MLHFYLIYIAIQIYQKHNFTLFIGYDIKSIMSKEKMPTECSLSVEPVVDSIVQDINKPAEPGYREIERTIGAKSLTAISFEKTNKPIVDSSFEKVRRLKQKLVNSSNADRRNDAYLTRLEKIVNKHGPKAERILWQKSIEDPRLIIGIGDIPNSFWNAQAQIRRDNGIGEVIGAGEKLAIAEDIQGKQRDSIEIWAEYFAQEDCPFPLWFKTFTWNSVIKMSAIYDRSHKCFAKRDKSTVAPYPQLNPAALAKVYDSIYQANVQNEKTETSTQDVEVEKGAKNFNFNQLYSFFLSKQKLPLEVPQNPDGIDGEWIEYRLGDEDKLAEAAVNTPWCIASSAVGRSYLENKKGIGSRATINSNEAKFILFHLRDEDTGQLANSACASIRLDSSGNVAEISGIRDGQTLDDSLLPIVEKKALSLPGGEKYLKAFADKRELIRLDKKIKNNEELTTDELRFIYEVDRPIRRVGEYSLDPRVEEIKAKYPLRMLREQGIVGKHWTHKYAKRGQSSILPLIEAGISIKEILRNNHSFEIQDVDKLLAYGVSHQEILKINGIDWALDNMDYLASRGFNAKEIVEHLSASKKLEHLGFLDSNNVSYDLDNLIKQAYRISDISTIMDNRDAILKHGGKLSYKKLARKMSESELIKYADVLCANGAEKAVVKAITRLKKEISPRYYYNLMGQSLDSVLKSGVMINDLSEIVNNTRNIANVIDNYDEIMARGIKPKLDISKLKEEGAVDERTMAVIVSHQDVFDLQEVCNALSDVRKIIFLDTLTANGVELNALELSKKVEPTIRLLFNKQLNRHGAHIDIESETSNLSFENACKILSSNLDKAKDAGVNIDKVASIIMANQEITPSRQQLFTEVKPILWRLGYIK